MKKQLNFRFVFLTLLSVFLLTSFSQNLYAQDGKKNTVRLTVDYTKIMGGESYLDIKTRARIDKVNTTVPNIDLKVVNELEDKEIDLGTVKTNMDGTGRFVLNDLNTLRPDSTNTYNIVVSFKGNDAFKRASRSVAFKDAHIAAKLVTKDSINFIEATLTDGVTSAPIMDESLNVQLDRLFRPLPIGEEFNLTDDNGTILVPIVEGLPGVDGILKFEVVLNDSDDYGTVKAIVQAPIGTPIVDESTFDDRTMWSPRNKTPIFLLVFPNLLILGMWGLIVYLFINLYKISKSKT
jgi:hypothetical protein